MSKKKKDGTFTCDVKLSGGGKAQVTVTQTSDHNTFSYAFKSGSVELPGSTVDKEVEQDLADAGLKDATVNCPATVPVKTGTTVTCPITTSSGRQATVSFTFSDSSGDGRLLVGGGVVNPWSLSLRLPVHRMAPVLVPKQCDCLRLRPFDDRGTALAPAGNHL